MELKEFLKLTIGKIAVFLILMGGLNYIWISGTHVVDARILVGLPLGFWPIGSSMAQTGMTPPTVEFSWTNFVIDVLFWYAICCAIIEAYRKIRK